jgi:hypothetical protein
VGAAHGHAIAKAIDAPSAARTLSSVSRSSPRASSMQTMLTQAITSTTSAGSSMVAVAEIVRNLESCSTGMTCHRDAAERPVAGVSASDVVLRFSVEMIADLVVQRVEIMATLHAGRSTRAIARASRSHLFVSIWPFDSRAATYPRR